MSKTSYHRLPEDHGDNRAIKSNTLPLPLAGEACLPAGRQGVRVGLELNPPHLSPLPKGRGD